MTNNSITFRVVGISILLAFISSLSVAQEIPTYIPLTFVNPNNSFKDLNQLDSVFEGVQIVGMGESTHGTHEFNTMRHRFFKYLVLNHGFNTLFLEADYANCLMADDYVHRAGIDKYEAINNLALWPWMTEEMGDLFDWMRSYNLENPDSVQLKIIGVDMQMYNSTLKELDKILVEYNLQPTDTTLYKPITEAEFRKLNKKEVKPYLELVKQKLNVDIQPFSKLDQDTYLLLNKHLEQVLESKIYPKDNSFRDVKMGENILFHLKKTNTIKGLFWAHNGHIFNIYSSHKKTGKINGYAGGVLKESLKEKYFSIIQEFDEGSFNAYHKMGAKNNDKTKEDYVLGPVTIEQSIENSFGALFRNTPENYLFVSIESLTPEPNKYLLQHLIGAQYLSTKDNQNQTSQFNHCTTGCFDAMVFIKHSTPTNLINSPKKN